MNTKPIVLLNGENMNETAEILDFCAALDTKTLSDFRQFMWGVRYGYDAAISQVTAQLLPDTG